ncbi:MAG: response regulator transcription factor [Chloroflexi bacterium]|nr:response regulator transcription factor [Chloroflexota bacterium]
MKVLIIEDDPEIVESISLAFRIRWPEAEVLSSRLGSKGIELVKNQPPDAVILDLGLPDMSGFEVLKQIRAFSSIPIIILTISSEESNVVKGLELGADDYVTKPFRQLELLARVKSMLRHHGTPEDESPVVYGALRYHPAERQVALGQKEISLTRAESRIMQQLLRQQGRVVTHSCLAEALWGTSYPGAADSLKVHIRRLREKLEEDPGEPQLILTKPGVGYYLSKTGES